MDNKINNNPMEVSIMSERKYPVITISREFGAGGHSIARVVSERLGIPYYDREGGLREPEGVVCHEDRGHGPLYPG